MAPSAGDAQPSSPSGNLAWQASTLTRRLPPGLPQPVSGEDDIVQIKLEPLTGLFFSEAT